ncbi:hypothetical protein HYDPIDRAFT_97437 [Hydnomerulius pinastri MD-312]|uniref:Unplaced genomic scaffold scaffold_32, whole genome shotgun sequence n=1 Tax=Hydnomerulius pinastri MD-312 TaxID=994086 RepID=A0A0C9WBA3_9AGAM|nr:hypothetical protein HYDPIDRAFT_97437 [Hydnomerulius pinastri MD-312]
MPHFSSKCDQVNLWSSEVTLPNSPSFPQLDLTSQARIPAALSAIYNFIWIHNPCEGDFPNSHEPIVIDEDGFGGEVSKYLNQVSRYLI